MRSSTINGTAQGALLGVIAFVLISSSFPLPAIAATTNTSGPLFSMTLIAPTSNPIRRQWAAIITNSFGSLNIAANLVFVSFDVLLNDFFGCPSGCPPPTYANGGWDAGFVGFGGGTPLPDFGTQNVIVYRDAGPGDVPPKGSNYYFFDNSTYNTLSLQYSNSFSQSARVPLIQQMMSIVMQQRPTMVLFYPYSVYAWSSQLQSWGPSNAIDATTANSDFSHWKDSSGSNVLNIGETGDITAVTYTPNSAQNSYYMGYLAFPVQACGECLDPRTTSYYDGTVSSVTSTADHLTWTVTEKAHAFSDGVGVTSNDYIYNLMTGLITAVGEVGTGTLQGLLGLNTQFTFTNGTTRYVMNGTYYATKPSGFVANSTFTASSATTWTFTMPSPYVFTDPIITGVGAVPMHLYQTLPFTQWSTSWPAGLTSSAGGLSTGSKTVSYNTAQGCGGPCTGGSGSATVYGPMGDGAYIYHGYDPTALVGTDVINPNYYNITGLQTLGWDKIQTVHVVYINGKDAAEAALANNQVNFLDSNYQFNAADVSSLESSGFTVVKVNDPSNGWQEMGLNLNNPVFGTGTATPLGQSNPSEAAYAARQVREALSYAIPRQYIVDQLLGGLGQVGIAQVAPSFTFAYPAGAAPDPYDLAQARVFLANAGYNTGVNPNECPTCTGIPGTTVGGVTVPGFILGNSFTLQGQFKVDPVLGATSDGFAVTLQQSTDGGTTWTSVALGSTNAGGAFSINYMPSGVTGNVEYRVFFTGLPQATVTTDALGSASAVESLVPPLATTRPLNVTDVAYGPTVTYNIGTLASVFTALTSNINAGFANQTTNVNTKLSQVGSQINDMNTNVNGLSGQISTLNSNLSTTTDIAYVAIAVAIILGIAAIALSRRKPA